MVRDYRLRHSLSFIVFRVQFAQTHNSPSCRTISFLSLRAQRVYRRLFNCNSSHDEVLCDNYSAFVIEHNRVYIDLPWRRALNADTKYTEKKKEKRRRWRMKRVQIEFNQRFMDWSGERRKKIYLLQGVMAMISKLSDDADEE
jgi:hypothetical protein